MRGAGWRTGEVAQIPDVVWVTSILEEAEQWAAHGTLKATPAEIRAMGAGGIAVYEVEPEGFLPLVEKHLDGEAACRRARVVREVVFDAFELDLCRRLRLPRDREHGR